MVTNIYDRVSFSRPFGQRYDDVSATSNGSHALSFMMNALPVTVTIFVMDSREITTITVNDAMSG